MAIQNADKTNFKELIGEDFVIADFYGTTCVPCKLFSKILEDIAAEIPFLNIVKLNTTENPELAAEYGITAVPTVHFYKDGHLVESHVGVMQPQAVKDVIPGHSIPLGALGVFILWLGWYGFNGAAATTATELSAIFLTTTIAPSVATCTTMVYTWVKNGKPDVSMCLNASLAGLVGITAGCDALDAVGAAIVGLVSGILVVVVVEALDLKLHIDDPVGAVGVHMANGIWGTLAVGLLAAPSAPAGLSGMLYTGSASLLGIQLLGVASVSAYAAAAMVLTFQIMKKTVGLRASMEEELRGLDASEHGLPSAYADFAPAVDSYSGFALEGGLVPAAGATSPAEILPADWAPASESPAEGKFTKIDIVCKEERLYALKEAMSKLGITGMTVSHVMGCGVQKGKPEYYRGVAVETSLLPKVQVSIVVSAVPVQDVIATAKKALYTGHIGDGKIFIYNVENVVKVRTGEEGFAALQDKG